MRVASLTTSDNPYDPYVQFDQWFQFDELHDYHCCALLARCAPVSNELSSRLYNELIEQTIDSIIKNVPTGVENVQFVKKIHNIQSKLDEDQAS